MSTNLGEAFVNQLLGKIPAEQREAVQSALTSPDALAFLGTAAAQTREAAAVADRVRQREERLSAWHQELDVWAKAKEKEYAERERTLGSKSAGAAADPPLQTQTPPATAAAAAITHEAVGEIVAKTLEAREGAYVQFTTDLTSLVGYHLRNFNEELDTTAIVRHPQIRELGVKGVYELLHKDQISKRAADAAAAAENKIREDERAKVMASIAASTPVQLPYPLGEDTSPLAALALEKAPTGDPAVAAQMYQELMRR